MRRDPTGPSRSARPRPRFAPVAELTDLVPGVCRLVELEGRDLVLLRLDGQVYALDNRCPHQGGPLNQGRVDGRAIVCPWHGWRWDAKTGRAVWPEVDWRAESYPVVVEDGRVLVRVE